jgi:hypothetical protein
MGKLIGQILLIEHCGKPTVWDITRSDQDDSARLDEMFNRAVSMCAYELAHGGVLKLVDSSGNIIKEQRATK